MGENITEHNKHVLWDEEDEFWVQLDEQEDAHDGSAADKDNERCCKHRCQAGDTTLEFPSIFAAVAQHSHTLFAS
jgi:hypothetical protein